MSLRRFPAGVRVGVLFFALIAVSPPLTLANTLTGPAITGEHDGWNFVPADTIQSWIQQCIDDNHAHAPPGNPGPFTRGYNSIIVLDGQCFSRGIYSMLGLATRMVVGSAADWAREARWNSPNLADTTKARWSWLEEFWRQVRANPNRPVKDILDAVRAANPDPPANTPAPDYTDGGDGVVLGNPSNAPGLSYHAVIFAGKLSDKGPPDRESENAATRRAVSDARDTLVNSCHVPTENIRTVYPPATWDSLKLAIQSTWQHMNDNEQFILVFADHANILHMAKSMAIPGPGPDEQEGEVPTEEESVSPNAFMPDVFIETAFVMEPATVKLNGVTIGTLSPSLFLTRRTLPFPPGLLVPLGQLNSLRIGASPANAAILRFGIGTGPVAGAPSSGTALPGSSRSILLVLALLCLGTGGLRIRRRATRSD